MIDLSFHILDLVQNSIAAGASSIEIEVCVKKEHRTIMIKDNGCGMDEEMQTKAIDPFFTKRTTRKVGLGLALFQETCMQANGKIVLDSNPYGGTVLTGFFEKNHIDAIELGNIGEALYILFSQNQNIEFSYVHQVGESIFRIESNELYQTVAHHLLFATEIMHWIEQYINEHIQSVEGERNENIRRIKNFT